nr:NAD(P)/FAD-dependent oxidoreductase [Streptomyces xiaopingdaonensis]
MPMSDAGTPVHVIGAGPAGLATAAALTARGLGAVVLERGEAVGASWRAHYEGLRLQSTRAYAELPGLPPQRTSGGRLTRDDFVAYLERYATHHRVEVATGVEVFGITRAGEQWRLEANGGRRLTTPAVVVATGLNHTPYTPSWPGRDRFEGELLHSADYRTPAAYEGSDVLVVGCGSSGTGIAADLARGGASRVRLAVRTPRHLVRRSSLGWPAQRSAVLARRLPTGLGDRLSGRLTRVENLGKHGFPHPRRGICSAAAAGAPPVVDDGFSGLVRGGRIEPVAGVDRFSGAEVRLADGSSVRPDAVVAATGYRSALDQLVGDLGQLDGSGRPLVHGPRTLPHSPGLHFAGFTRPVSGALRELAHEARRIAQALVEATS